MTWLLGMWALVVTAALAIVAWAWNALLDELSKEPCPKCGYDPKEDAR